MNYIDYYCCYLKNYNSQKDQNYLNKYNSNSDFDFDSNKYYNYYSKDFAYSTLNYNLDNKESNSKNLETVHNFHMN